MYPKWKHEIPALPHKLFNDLFTVLVELYKEHVRRDIDDGKLKPVDSWLLLRGFLVSAAQTYASICILVEKKRPKPLMLQAAILNRSLLETLGNVLALCEAPKSRSKILLREAYKNMALTFLRYHARWGGDPKWTEYLDVYRKVLANLAKELRLSRASIKNPSAIRDQWPTPGVMVYGSSRNKQPPFLHGNRRAAFQEIYDFHYGRQSEQAHQRAAAVGMALLVDNPEAQWNPGHGESYIISTALLLIACIVSEIEQMGRYSVHPRLLELWAYLRDADDEAKELWALRYRRLLKV
jgi:hypothetical protein